MGSMRIEAQASSLAIWSAATRRRFRFVLLISMLASALTQKRRRVAALQNQAL